MNVRCENCKQTFETPVHAAGKIEYARCKNVFRVAYRFRTPCPHCKKVLRLTPHGTRNAIGIALNLPEDEETEAFLVSSERPHRRPGRSLHPALWTRVVSTT